MKNLFYFLSFIVLTSCSGDSEITTDAPLLIKKIVSTNKNNSRNTIFTYDGTKLDAIIVDNISMEYSYTGDNITKISRNNAGLL